MSLPWDDLHPEEPPPRTHIAVDGSTHNGPAHPCPTCDAMESAPPPPTEPVSNLPEVPTREIDFAKVLKDAFVAALREARPQAREAATGYAKETIDHVVHGDQIEWGHPTITATTSQGKELVVADAKSRSWRTFLQGLIFDIGFALVAVLTTLAGADPFQKQTWILFGAMVVKTLIQTVISYIMRLRITPTIRPPTGEKMAVVPTFAAIPEKQRR